MNDLYAHILATVVENGRIEDFDSDLEIEAEIEFEAGERGLDAEQTADAVAYALAHIQR